MRKIICLTLAFLIVPHQVEAKPKIAQLIFGIAFLGAGAYMALDGFSKQTDVSYETVTMKKDVDVSAPGITSFSGWSWNKYQIITWWADASGAFTNTGNVTLNGLRATVTFYDSFGVLASNSVFTSPSTAAPGDSVGWSRTANNTVFEPFLATVDYSYSSYTPKYETKEVKVQVKKETTKIKNQTEGYAGVAVASLGAFLTTKYFISRYRMDHKLTVVPVKNASGLALRYKFG